ncbi:MAG: hypothetical protein AB1394_04210 [Bacteroidota bacterium]
MDAWKIKLVNSETITVKAKKKDLIKADKSLICVKKLEDNSDSEVLINPANVLWCEKLKSEKEENE